MIRRHRPAFTLIEMLATVAALVILLGLMVSLARYVRNRSANELTGRLLARLEVVLGQYQIRNDGQLPPVPPLLAADDRTPSEAELQRRARANNAAVVRALRQEATLASQELGDVSLSVYDETSLRDAWGTPIVYMPAQHPLVGMAPQNRPFFVSAGQDGQLLTREDNLYSYEIAELTAAGPIP